MGTIIEFIESESFFPLLILLFVALLCIFTSILMSSKKKRKKIVTERKSVKIDESAQVQLVSEHGRINQFGTMEENETLEIETGGSEVNLFIESVDIDELEQSNLEENDSTIYDFEPIFPINKEKFSKEEVEVTPYIEDEKELSVSITEGYQNDDKEMETNYEEEVEVTPYVEDEKESSVSITEVNQNDNEETEIDYEEKLSDESEEIETIHEDITSEINEESTIKEGIPDEDIYEKEEKNAFTIKPDDNKEIKEDIVVEKHEEYSNKTEILEFPDFDTLNQDTKIEDEVIDAANKYIESIMNR